MQTIDNVLRSSFTKFVVICALGVPMLVLGGRLAREFMQPGSAFGADPADEIVDYLGQWSIRMLFITLGVSSVARLTKTPLLIRIRRACGVWAFCYVLVHFLSYFAFLTGFDIEELYQSIYKRPYIVFGMIALTVLIPLAITSTNGWQRRLRRNWQRLHRLVYIAAIAAWIHLFWQEKASFEESAIYGIILVVLFAERLANTIIRRRKRSRSVGYQTATPET